MQGDGSTLSETTVWEKPQMAEIRPDIVSVTIFFIVKVFGFNTEMKMKRTWKTLRVTNKYSNKY